MGGPDETVNCLSHWMGFPHLILTGTQSSAQPWAAIHAEAMDLGESTIFTHEYKEVQGQVLALTLITIELVKP